MIRLDGNSNSELRIAEWMRSRDSRTAVSARPDDRERRQPRADVDLDPDLARVDPVDRERGDAGEHELTVRGVA